MPRFDCINFHQNRPKLRLLFSKKTQNCRALGAPSPDPQYNPPHCRIFTTRLDVVPVSGGITTILLLLVRFCSMDSWLKKLHDNGNTADYVEAAVKTSAN